MASKMARSENNMEQFQSLVPGYSQFINYTDTAEYSANLEADTSLLELFSTTDCWIRVVPTSSSAVASVPSESVKTLSYPLKGGITAFIGLPDLPETQYKVSVVRASVSGTLYLTEGA